MISVVVREIATHPCTKPNVAIVAIRAKFRLSQLVVSQFFVVIASVLKEAIEVIVTPADHTTGSLDILIAVISRCTRQLVTNVETNAKYHLSQLEANLSFVAIALVAKITAVNPEALASSLMRSMKS